MLPKFADMVTCTYLSVLAKTSSALADALGQHRQILLQQHDAGRVLGHVDGGVHRDADVGVAQRGRIVDAVAEVADRVAASSQRRDDGLLVQRVDLGEDRHPADQRVETFVVQSGQVGAGEHGGCIEAHGRRGMCRGEPVVASDHSGCHAEGGELGDRLRRAGLGWVGEAEEADEVEIRFVGRTQLGRMLG